MVYSANSHGSLFETKAYQEKCPACKHRVYIVMDCDNDGNRVACGMCRIVSARFCGRGLLEDLGCGRGQCGNSDLGAAVIVRAGTQVGKGRERRKGW